MVQQGVADCCTSTLRVFSIQVFSIYYSVYFNILFVYRG